MAILLNRNHKILALALALTYALAFQLLLEHKEPQSLLALFLEQIKDHLCSQFGIYGEAVAKTKKSLVLEEPRLDDYLDGIQAVSTPAAAETGGNRAGTRQAETPKASLYYMYILYVYYIDIGKSWGLQLV